MIWDFQHFTSKQRSINLVKFRPKGLLAMASSDVSVVRADLLQRLKEGESCRLVLGPCPQDLRADKERLIASDLAWYSFRPSKCEFEFDPSRIWCSKLWNSTPMQSNLAWHLLFSHGGNSWVGDSRRSLKGKTGENYGQFMNDQQECIHTYEFWDVLTECFLEN